jgi:hypothetical protein
MNREQDAWDELGIDNTTDRSYFVNSKEQQLAKSMEKAGTKAITEFFGVDESAIYRHFNNNDYRKPIDEVLDRQYCIDLIVTLKSGSKITMQEKALSHKYHTYNTITMEYYQDRFTKAKGEFFNLHSQYYLSGYANDEGTEYVEYRIVDIPRLMMWISKTYTSAQLDNMTRPSGGSNASFIYFDYDKIPQDCILYHFIKE